MEDEISDTESVNTVDSLSSTTAVHIWIISYKLHVSVDAAEFSRDEIDNAIEVEAGGRGYEK